MSDDHRSLNQIIDFRKEKLAKLRDGGVEPYPQKYEPTHFSADILGDFENLEKQDVNIAGRIMSMRKMGKASFFHIQDQQGRIQVFIRRDDVGEDNYANFKLLDIGDFVGVKGYVFKTKMGEISIHAGELTVLCKSIRPLPVVKEKEGETFDAFADKEQRYRNRHLDLIVNPEVKDAFVKRAKIIKGLRGHLDNLGFLEVETPVLQPLYGGANARPFTTHHNALDQQLYLRIADELYLKRLIIGGIDRVYEISKDFRNEGMDRNHNPEFTMLEFYWAYADFEDNMNLVEDMIRSVAKSIDALQLKWGDMEIDLSKPFGRRPILDLLKDATGEDLTEASDEKMKAVCKTHHIEVEKNANYGQMLDELMGELVEPTLIQPTFITDYPKVISPLAKKHRNGNPHLVERFELIIGGAEFANAFTELNDPIDQRERFASQARLAEGGDEEAQPVDENFLQAVECGMPPTGGVGIGVDRLVMLLTENVNIKDVILFPAMRTEEL
ncbi:MAG: lysine--tRNA ligase [Candidatus Marinimicrobia bacterium]|jgi:lysyl-tRNA synthetase class 2|nr:lysine--tRNA ligase [Candidatus Neomarinimicrobiota bacterium]|tara:strand:+ start:7698 stop:9191 length:1494 start_codon:yes stop_codon:yes gene_type:complete